MTSTPITDRIEALRLAEQTQDDLAALLQRVADVNAELRRGLIERASEAARLRQQVWDLECARDDPRHARTPVDAQPAGGAVVNAAIAVGLLLLVGALIFLNGDGRD
jgi:hypothetical protein